MRQTIAVLVILLGFISLQAQTIEKTYTFANPEIHASKGYYQVTFPGTLNTANPGDPMIPYQSVSLLLPPGMEATSMTITGKDMIQLPGTYLLYPQQHVAPLSVGPGGEFIRNDAIYQSDQAYPVNPMGNLTTEFLNGYGIALGTFTPVIWHPENQSIAYYEQVTVTIEYAPSAKAEKAQENLVSGTAFYQRVRSMIDNRDFLENYPVKAALKSSSDMVIITKQAWVNGFQPLVDFYTGHGIACEVVSTETIDGTMSGADMQEKIRNYIIETYQTNGTGFVLLGGDSEIIPIRGFYCQVQSSSIYEDDNIPADLYYSALDGTWDDNDNGLWGEPEEDDLLPEVAVARFPFSNASELSNMINKTIIYQDNPIESELARPYMVGEHMYDDPLSFGSDYLELLIGDHNDNGYFTHGIPEENNDILRLYDTLISLPTNYFHWNVPTLLNQINQGRSIIHHAGHCNVNYMMRLFNSDITNQNFSEVNGVDHNYQIMYTHGCLCGAFDDNCIAEKCVTIENFLVAGVFNSRYGWFNEGQTEGPSAHLHREFVSALYHDTTQINKIGETHMQSKIMTAPWVTAPGQWEPGALRWCFYCSNVFGDPIMQIWTEDSSVAIPESHSYENTLTLIPNPASSHVMIQGGFSSDGSIAVTISNLMGQTVIEQQLPVAKNQSVQLSLENNAFVSGIYLVTLQYEGNIMTGKLIIQK
jgi:hypothetical protein